MKRFILLCSPISYIHTYLSTCVDDDVTQSAVVVVVVDIPVLLYMFFFGSTSFCSIQTHTHTQIYIYMRTNTQHNETIGAEHTQFSALLLLLLLCARCSVAKKACVRFNSGIDSVGSTDHGHEIDRAFLVARHLKVTLRHCWEVGESRALDAMICPPQDPLLAHADGHVEDHAVDCGGSPERRFDELRPHFF